MHLSIFLASLISLHVVHSQSVQNSSTTNDDDYPEPQGASCISLDDNDVHSHGDEYTSTNGHFRYRCDSGKEMIIGCYYKDESNADQLMPVDSEPKTVNHRQFKCERLGDGVRYSNEVVECVYNAARNAPQVVYHLNETWVDRSAKFVCAPGGVVKATGGRSSTRKSRFFCIQLVC